MPTHTQDLSIETDTDGFLLHPEDWNELVANRLAELDGIAPLTEAHWSVIQTLRRHWDAVGGVPALHHVCMENHLDPHCILALFKDNGREAWRLAGLPNPGEEANNYL
ncbi:MAG: TusE/DsrC/DsvC family sulfur relay protein [Gammaproteobacteria bacterium]